jgi:uncharacterized surface protein with fasciclin (FAS1) repeats
LIGSAGLLLTTDMRAAQNGVSPLSAFFIGLLGFVSGLLYDEAFARVRRVGSQLFSADRPETADNARQEDRALAQVLTGVSASLAAGLVRKYGIGTRLALEPGFTLLVPSDEAMGNLNLKTWTAVNDDTAAFEHWFHRHHAGKRIAKADVAGEAAVKELEVDEGPPYVLTIDDGQLKIGNARVLVADVPWKNGIIQVLREDVE